MTIKQYKYEVKLKDSIFPELEFGRPNWDKPHTKAVIEHMKTLIESSFDLQLDKDVLIIASYAHDWGYSGLFKNGKALEITDVTNVKKEHMIVGARKLSLLLQDDVFNFLSDTQKKRAVHLVHVHDDLTILKDQDELVLMEADTLGGLDVSKVKPAFDNDSNDKYMRGVKKKRYPLFITDYGKQEFERLFEMRENYYNTLRG